MKKVMVLVVLMIAATMIWFLSDPINRLLVFDPIGTASSSGYVLVNEGESLYSARNKLTELGLIEVGETTSERCANHINESANEVVMFRDLSWRRGVFCVFARDDQVMDLSWWFDPIAP
ncbi:MULTISPECIES: hypothetical protein [unclassified Oceanicaulis]|uniref:hypothetical protein n=1 Tax=unclassified Oceanicaulis TaxID=2632123 RepID=UPI0025E4C40B|nr:MULTISPECIES: hypothetical protein [unclassified Oceanicaulis]|tara:strand:+ start:181 stop:537 length:357 start_codon:yes stop_codon:yes gene_type:complete